MLIVQQIQIHELNNDSLEQWKEFKAVHSLILQTVKIQKQQQDNMVEITKNMSLMNKNMRLIAGLK